jgi:hypothetical protein
MADLKDLAEQYGLEDYEQLLGGYPNATKFITGLKDAAVRSVPTTEQMRDPNFIIDAAGLGGAIKAYHGTPHLFDRFDMSKIGTGEGAQAYGHGLYFAENPLVAKTYMTAGVPVDEYQNKIFLKKYNADIAKLRGDKEKEAALLQEIKDMKAQKGGNLYETSIRWPNAEREATDPLGEHHLLDWDQPLSEQSDYVRNKLKKSDFYKNANKAYKDQKQWYLDPSQKTGESFLKYMRSGYDDEFASSIKDAEQYLKNLDIPGLKYLDATSRSTDKGTRNYVMFGDEYPEIIKRAGSLDELQEKYAEGGIVKAQDQNENLGKLAEMLGSARDVGNQYTVPSWVPLAGGVGAGDLLMGKTPEEIENWSYGNAPMQIPEMSNVPQFKRGRAQSLADALTTLAPGVKATEGLPAGLSFIGPKSRNWDKVAAELAAKKLDEGADPAEVWREHLIGRMPDKTLFSEISDKEMSHVIPLNKWVNRENGQLMAPNISTAWDEAASTLTPNAPVRIKRLFEHDQLKNEYPYGFTKNYENQSIMDMPVFMQEKNNKSYGSLGDEDLTLNPSLLPKEARSTVLHELQHAIQNQEGWGKGGSPAEFELSDFSKSYWQNIYDKSNDQQSELLQSLLEKKKAGEIDNNDIRLQMESLANRNGRSIAETMLRRDKNPIESYKRLAGEAQARATQDRLDMDMVQRRENYPLAGGKLSDIPLEDLIYKYEGNGPSLSMDPLSKYKDYVGEHSAPLGDSGAPLHDLTANENAIYPSDVYSSQANQYYGTGEPEDAQLFAMAQRLKDKPNEKVSIYRAVPKMQSNSEKIAGLEKDLANYMKRGRMPKNADFDNKSDWYEWASNERDRLASLPEETIEPLSINHGDWVALDKKYAKEHGESALGGNYKILSKKVPARQLFTNGDSIREWGWDSRYAEGGEVDLSDDNGYADDLARLKRAYENSNFGPEDSMIASTIHHPVEAARRAKDAFMRSIDTASGRPREILDESSVFPFGIAPSIDEQAQAGLDLAGLAQTGAMPFAPESAGGTLGTIHKLRIGDLGYDLRFDDRKLEQEKLQNMMLQLTRPENEKRIISLANYEGYPFVTSMSDRTNVGNLHYINDRPVDVDLQGGQDYMFNNPGQVWASGKDPVNAIMKYGKELSARTGGLDPLYMPWRMAPTGGDYANMTGETMLKYMNANMNKKEKRAVNKSIKDFIPDFKGIESEEGIDQFRNTPDKVRKELKNHLDTKYRNAGGISIGEARLAVADPSQLLAPDTGLQNVGQIFVGNPIIQESGHRAYPKGVPGQGLGMLDRDISAYELMPDVAEYRGLMDLKNPRTRDIRALQMKPYGGIITDKVLRNLGYAKGGEVKALHDKYEESDYGYGNRPDKTKKGLGYFGELERPDGTGVMTEYSIGVPINGEEMDVPTLIPTLTPDEIRLILHMQDGEDMPRSIVHKAIDHAHQRLSEGKPIFATEEDLYAHGGIVDVLHNDAIEQIMKAFMDSMEDEQEEEEPAAVSIQITTHSQPLKSGKIPTSIREAKHG